MKNENAFHRTLSVLIVVLLLTATFYRGEHQIFAYAAAFTAAGIAYLWMMKDSILLCCRIMKARRTQKAIGRRLAIPPEQAERTADSTTNILIQHVNCRITAYLRSVYPDVKWTWDSENQEAVAIAGATGTLQIFNVPEFNYASVQFDSLQRLKCKLMNVVPLSQNQGVSSLLPQEQPIDLEVWYSMKGKALMQGIIAELNGRGYESFVISDAGAVKITQGTSSTVHTQIKSLPARRHWNTLIPLFERDGITASIEESGLALSWVA